MKTIINKLRGYSQVFFIIYVLLVIFGTSLLNAGYTFFSITAFGLSSIGLLILWLFCPDKNFSFIRRYYLVYCTLILFYVFYYLSFFIEPFANFGYNDLILYSTAFIIFLTTSTIKWEKIIIRRTFIALSITATALCLYGIYRYLYSPFDRLTSIFYLSSQQYIAFPNAFAQFLLLILPLQTLYLFHQSEVANLTLKKLYFYFSSVVLYTSFFLTFSRGAIITIFILMLGFILLQFVLVVKNKSYFTGKSIQRLIGVIFVCFILLNLVNVVREWHYPINTLTEKMNFQADEGLSSIDERIEFMKGSLYLIKDNPVFGIGTQNFIYFYPEYQENMLSVSNHPHNAVLKFAVENGLITIFFGFASVIILLFYFVKNLKNVEQKYYAGMLGFTVFGVLIHNSVDYNFNFVATIGIFALLTGLLVTRLPAEHKKISKSFKISTLITILVFTGVTFVVSAHEADGNIPYKKGRELLTSNIPKTIEENQVELITNNLMKADDELKKAVEKRWFKRDFQIMRANIYRYLYDQNLLEPADILIWISLAQEATVLHPENPTSWNAYGVALFANNETEKANKAFNKALSIDSMNYLEFHYYQLISSENPSKLLNEKYELVTKYKGLLERNAHLTVVTDNPKYGAKIYEELITFLPNEDLPSKEELENELEEYMIIWLQEKNKMNSVYGVDFGD